MNKIFILILALIIIIYIVNIIKMRNHKADYLKAGKKWEGIVKELSRRK